MAKDDLLVAADILEENGLTSMANAVRKKAEIGDSVMVFCWTVDMNAKLAFDIPNNSGSVMRKVRDVLTDPLKGIDHGYRKM